MRRTARNHDRFIRLMPAWSSPSHGSAACIITTNGSPLDLCECSSLTPPALGGDRTAYCQPMAPNDCSAGRSLFLSTACPIMAAPRCERSRGPPNGGRADPTFQSRSIKWKGQPAAGSRRATARTRPCMGRGWQRRGQKRTSTKGNARQLRGDYDARPACECLWERPDDM